VSPSIAIVIATAIATVIATVTANGTLPHDSQDSQKPDDAKPTARPARRQQVEIVDERDHDYDEVKPAPPAGEKLSQRGAVHADEELQGVAEGEDLKGGEQKERGTCYAKRNVLR